MNETDKLVALALKVADDLEAPAAPRRMVGLGAGLLRRLARELATGPELVDGCPVCTAPLGGDPRRRYCSPRCRQAAYRSRRRDASVTGLDD